MADDAANAFFNQVREKEQEVRNAIGKAIGSLLSPAATDIPDDFLSPVESVVAGARQYLTQNYDRTRIDEFPALELVRVYDREVPRDFKIGEGGKLVPVPDDDWPSRWQAAAKESGDNNAAQILQKTGRMIALKSSGIWQALGDGAGGYDDTLGNAFAPFAFGSGMDTDEMSREDAVALGLMDDTDTAEPATIPSPEQIAERFAAKLRQYLAKLQGEEQKRRSDPLTFGTSDDLVELAQEKINSAEKLTPELIEEVKFLVGKAIDKGISEDDESLAYIYDAIGEPEKANVCRQGAASRHAAEILDRGNSYTLIQAAESLLANSKELTPEISKQLLGLVEKAFERGVDEKYNLRTKAHAILVTVYQQMHEPEKAESHRQQYIESADGFWLLDDAKSQLAALGKEATVEAGARILDLLTKAVQKIPDNFPNYHAEAYRTTAEVLEAIGDIAHAVEYYECALQKNPKIPVKRRLNALKKTVQVEPHGGLNEK
jgi:tetratricopeptide (TPR) repeat protein